MIKKIAIAAVAVLLAASVVPAGTATVGSFVMKLAETKNLNVVDQQAAVDGLSRIGVRLPAGLDLAAPLTEGQVVSLARAAGVKVSTSSPDAPFDSTKLERFFASFEAEIGDGDSGSASTRSNNGNGLGGTFDPFSKGKGKGKGKNDMTPTEPE